MDQPHVSPQADTDDVAHAHVVFDGGLALDCGVMLPRLIVAYRTYGTLNADRSNAILVCHALTGDQYVAEEHPVTGRPGWWEAIVGPALAAVTAPRRLSAGCLTIGCSGPMAMELQYLSEPLMGRINAHLGKIAVTRLRLLQDLTPAPAPPPRPKPPAIAAASEAVAGLPPGELRDALEGLGRTVLTPR